MQREEISGSRRIHEYMEKKMLEIFDTMLDKMTTNLKYDELHYSRDTYCQSIKNPNEFAFWFPKIVNTGFRIPISKVIQLPLDLYYSVYNEEGAYSPKTTATLKAYISAMWPMTDGNLDIDSPLFFKQGTASGKFTFGRSCISHGLDDIVKKIRSTSYEALCCDKPQSAYLVFRELIRPGYDRPTIYGGMPLNTEFRVFYDFDSHSFIDAFNYWGDHDAMIERMDSDEAEVYESVYPVLEAEYSALLPCLMAECEEKLKDVVLRGKWSVDFLWTGNEFVLIDMATMAQSYFSDKVNEEGNDD